MPKKSKNLEGESKNSSQTKQIQNANLEALQGLPPIPQKAFEIKESFKTSDDEKASFEQNNLPAKEMTKEDLGEILAQQEEDDVKRDEIRSSTKHFTNDKNEWKLVHKTYNNNLDWELTTMAMKIGTRGVLVHIKEAIGQKITSTSQYIDNGYLEEKDGKWFIK